MTLDRNHSPRSDIVCRCFTIEPSKTITDGLITEPKRNSVHLCLVYVVDRGGMSVYFYIVKRYCIRIYQSTIIINLLFLRCRPVIKTVPLKKHLFLFFDISLH